MSASPGPWRGKYERPGNNITIVDRDGQQVAYVAYAKHSTETYKANGKQMAASHDMRVALERFMNDDERNCSDETMAIMMEALKKAI